MANRETKADLKNRIEFLEKMRDELLEQNYMLKTSVKKSEIFQEKIIDVDSTINAMRFIEIIRNMKAYLMKDQYLLLTREGALYFLTMLEEKVIEKCEGKE